MTWDKTGNGDIIIIIITTIHDTKKTLDMVKRREENCLRMSYPDTATLHIAPCYLSLNKSRSSVSRLLNTFYNSS